IRRGSVGRLGGRRLRDWIPALVVLVLMLVGWQLVVRGFHIKRFLLPAPTAIARTFWDERSSIWSAGWFTFQEALGGFAMGSGAAICSRSSPRLGSESATR